MRTQRTSRLLTVLGIVLLAAVLRLWTLTQLPVDFDEPDYVQAGYGYAAAMAAGDLGGVVDYAYNREHPPLVKLIYGLAVLALGDRANWSSALYAARLISAIFGLLAVLLLTLVDPLAGGLLAIHTLAVKYTSQAYLEALPLCAGLAAVLALTRSRRRARPLVLAFCCGVGRDRGRQVDLLPCRVPHLLPGGRAAEAPLDRPPPLRERGRGRLLGAESCALA